MKLVKGILLVIIIFPGLNFYAQTQPHPPAQKLRSGIGFYPTGTENGIGWRSGKDSRWALDARIAKASVLTNPEAGSFINELSVLRRIVYYERVRLHLGIGARTDWNFGPGMSHRYGVVIPIGVEAFPFPFQNAGLFFEAAPFVPLQTTTEAISAYAQSEALFFIS